MVRSSFLLLTVTLWAPLGCPTATKPGETGDSVATDTDADTDTDTDTDADSDTDTDTDSDTDTDTDTDTTPPMDADGDTYTDDVDCDDTDATVYPGAPEVQDDGIDQDCDGSDASAWLGVGELVAGDLTVTEVLQNPSAVGDTDGEWFELVNTSGVPVNLDGLVVSDLGTDSFTVSGTLKLDVGGIAVFGADGDTTLNGGVSLTYVWPSFNLGNDDDEIILSNGVEELDRVVWTGTTPWPDPNGASMSLDPAATDATSNDDGANWCAATEAWAGGDAGSPGVTNPICPTAAVDADGDGYDSTVDCDDTDPAINPGAADIAGDGVDQDCDGVDEKSSGSTAFAAGELIVTEVMPDPAAVSDSSGEWFEVYVNTAGTVDLTGVVVSDDGTSRFTISGLSADPGDHLVFAVDGDSATNGGLTPDYVYASSFSLGNGSDGLTLSNADGSLIDTLSWDSGATFPDPTGASMQLDPGSVDATANDDGTNWCEATSPYGSGDLGTPGTTNDACPAAPVDADGDGADETTDCDDADPTVYPGAPEVADDGIDQDCDGVDSTSSAVPAGPGDLVITEIMQNPAAVDDNNGEWFEVEVTASTRVALAGIQIVDAAGTVDTLSGLEADPGDILVFVAVVEPATNGGVTGDWEYGTGIDLGNDTGSLTLLTADGTVVDAVAWDGGATFPDPDGASMQLDASVLDATDNDDGANWCAASTSTYGLGDYGTPGTANSSCTSAVDADGDGYDTDSDCDDGDPTVYPGAPEIADDGIDQDCDGVDTSSSSALGVDEIAIGDLVITEIMQNSTAVADASGEWFEVYNTSANTYDLDGLGVGDAGTDDFVVSGSVLIGPGEYLVFVNNADTSTNGSVPVGYAYDYGTFQLSNGDDEVILSNAAGVLDAVYYDGGPTFPDPSGASMGLNPTTIDATDNDDGANWCAATTAWAGGDFGSPGDTNEGC